MDVLRTDTAVLFEIAVAALQGIRVRDCRQIVVVRPVHKCRTVALPVTAYRVLYYKAANVACFAVLVPVSVPVHTAVPDDAGLGTIP